MSETEGKKAASSWLNVAVDYGPLLVFLGVYKFYQPPEDSTFGEIAAVIYGTIAFMIAAVAAIGIGNRRDGRAGLVDLVEAFQNQGLGVTHLGVRRRAGIGTGAAFGHQPARFIGHARIAPAARHLGKAQCGELRGQLFGLGGVGEAGVGLILGNAARGHCTLLNHDLANPSCCRCCPVRVDGPRANPRRDCAGTGDPGTG